MLEPPALRRDSRISLDLFSPAARLVDAQPILRGAADPCDTPDTPLSAHVATHGPIPMPLLRAAPVQGSAYQQPTRWHAHQWLESPHTQSQRITLSNTCVQLY